MSFLYSYIISLLIFLGIDIVWLSIIAKNLYQKTIGHLMAEKPNLAAAGVFYLFFIYCLNLFVIQHAIKSGDLKQGLINAALFGFVTYATYDLTNLATLKNWPVLTTIIDLIWGTFISVVVTLLTFLIIKNGK